MKPWNSGARHLAVAIVSTALIAGGGVAVAQTVDSVLRAEQQRLAQNREAQQRIDRVVQQTRSLVDDYKAVTKEIDGLKIYNRLMEAQTGKQQARLDEINESLDKATVINRQIYPLMERMIEGLEQFVQLDIPFLLEERTQRIDTLKDLMDEPNVSVAEKFRKVMEAFQIENEFGRTIESYTDTIEIDGGVREVEFLRIGRVALLFQSADGSMTGVWDQESKSWDMSDEHRNEVKKGLRVANELIAPELLLLPVPAPEEAG
jgi:predicted RNase H-like nuclease (RuvC/YqgF family)